MCSPRHPPIAINLRLRVWFLQLGKEKKQRKRSEKYYSGLSTFKKRGNGKVILFTMKLAIEQGLHVDEVRRPGLPKKRVLEMIDFLASEGFIYSTIDDDDYKSTTNARMLKFFGHVGPKSVETKLRNEQSGDRLLRYGLR